MSIELTGAIHSVRLLWDVVKANKTFTNYNELVAAVSEVNADLIAAQAATITAQKGELALTELVRELKEKVVTLENWDREAERYELCTMTTGTFTHRLKPGMERGEPLHYLCTNCYAERKKSVLQFTSTNLTNHGTCPRCKNSIVFAASEAVRYFPNLR